MTTIQISQADRLLNHKVMMSTNVSAHAFEPCTLAVVRVNCNSTALRPFDDYVTTELLHELCVI